MRKHYILLGGGFINASSPQEFVTQLRAMSYKPSIDDETFMRQVSQRCRVQSGAHIRNTSPEDFLTDLISHDYVYPISLS